MIQVVGSPNNRVHRLMYSMLSHGRNDTEYVIHPTKDATDILFLQYNTKTLNKLRNRKQVRTYALQPGLFCEPYEVRLPGFTKYFTFGRYHTDILKTHNRHLACIEAGSLRTEYLRGLITFPSTHVVVIDQPFNRNTNNTYPGFDWNRYLRDVCSWSDQFGLHVYFMPHYTRPDYELPNVECVRDYRILATACCVFTVYSTLGLECAAAGIPVISYVPLPNPRVLNFYKFGVRVVSSLKGVDIPSSNKVRSGVVLRVKTSELIMKEIVR